MAVPRSPSAPSRCLEGTVPSEDRRSSPSRRSSLVSALSRFVATPSLAPIIPIIRGIDSISDRIIPSPDLIYRPSNRIDPPVERTHPIRSRIDGTTRGPHPTVSRNAPRKYLITRTEDRSRSSAGQAFRQSRRTADARYAVRAKTWASAGLSALSPAIVFPVRTIPGSIAPFSGPDTA